MTEPADAQSQDQTTSLEHYLAPLRDHRRVILAVTLVTLALGAVVALAGPRSYSARTSVLIYPVAADPTEALQATDRSDDMATELRIAESRAVAEMAATELDALGIEATTSAAADAITVANPEDSRVLTIAYQASDPAVARVGSELAAAAYLAYRSELNAASRQIARTSIDDEIAVLQDRLAVAEEQSSQAAAGSSARLVAEVELASIDGQLKAQQDALADLSTLSIDAATVFDEASEPSDPDGLGTVQLLVGALAGGLVLGIIAAWILAALGVQPGAGGSALRTLRSARSQDDQDGDSDGGEEASDVDDPFDDSDTRDPLELLKALEAVEADPAITLETAPPAALAAEPEITEANASEPDHQSGIHPAAEQAETETETGPEAPTHDEATTLGAPITFGEPMSVPEPMPIPEIGEVESADGPMPAGLDPFQAEPALEFAVEAETGFETADQFTTIPADPFEAPALPHSPLVAELQANAAVQAELDAHEAEARIEADDIEAESSDREIDDIQASIEAFAAETEFDSEFDSEFGIGATAGSDETTDRDSDDESEASLTTGDPRELDPGPPSWDGPFVGPTTWDQLSALAAAASEGELEADDTETDDLDGGLDETAPDESPEAEAEVDNPTDNATDNAAEDEPVSANAELVATNDVDELFEELGRLGSAGPVAVLSLSDRNPAAGLTAGFELADELRAVGANVLLIDVRIENPVLDSLFDDGPGSGLAQVMTGEVVLGDAVRNLPGLDGLDLLTVGVTDADTADQLASPAFQRMLSEARLNYHSIVVIGDTVVAGEADGSADVERARSLAAAVDGLIIGTADPAGTAASDELVAVLDSFDTPTLQLVTAPVPAASGTVAEASSV